MIIKRSYFVVIFLCAISACTSRSTEPKTSPASAFDADHSDPAAVQLLDSVASASGGQKAWDETRYITWNADGDRDISWDKQTGKVRVDSKKNQVICIFNTNNNEGKVQSNGSAITDQAELSQKLAEAKQQFHMDVFDLFPAFTLKQNGYAFVYLGEETIGSGGRANVVVVERTEAVNLLPISKLFIDLKNNQILQIGYLDPVAPDSLKDLIVLDNYKPYGGLVLSADRSNGKGPRDVKIATSLPDNIFENF